MTAYDTADQVAFFDAMYDGAMRAEGHAGHRDYHYSVAGHAVRLRIAGKGFSDKLPAALAHLSRPPGEQPTLTIHAWDDVSTGTCLPRLVSRYLFFVEMHCFDYLGPCYRQSVRSGEVRRPLLDAGRGADSDLGLGHATANHPE